METMERSDDLNTGILHSLLGHLLRHAFNRAQAVFTAEFEAEGITPLQFMMLELIARNEGVSHSQVGRAMGTSASVVTMTLKPLIAAGHLTSAASARDRRMVCYRLTEQGAVWFSQVRPKIDRCEDRFAAGLTIAERTALAGMLRRLSGIGETDGKR